VKQKYVNFEVLVCDDGSIDNTEEVVAQYHNLLNIKYFKNDNWGGPARPRNIGINNAQGEWLCFLDSDDFWSEDKLETIDPILNDSIDLVYHVLGLFYNNSYSGSNKTLFTRALRGNFFIDLLINGNVINNSSIVVRRAIINKIGGVSEERSMIGCEDYNTLLKVALLTSNIVYIPKLLGYYDMHFEGISRKDMSIAHASAVKEFLHLCNEEERAKIDAHIKYMKCSYLVNTTYNSKIHSDILFCLKNGKYNIKIKALLLFIKNLIKPVSKN